MDLTDGLGVQPGPLVGQVVARNAGHRGVAQSHGGYGFGDPARLVGVVVRRFAGVDLAEVTTPGALRPSDQEGGLAVFPAFVDVGASGFLAHRVQSFALHERLQLLVFGTHSGRRFDPGGLSFDRGLRVAHLEAQHLPAVGGVCHARASARSKSSAQASCSDTRGTMSSGVTVRPSSREMLVTPASAIPQAMIDS